MAGPGYVADPRRAGTVAAICRRLDGIPLAIELAAGCVSGLRRRRYLPPASGDRFHLLTAGTAHGAAAPADSARDPRLELRTPVGTGTDQPCGGSPSSPAAFPLRRPPHSGRILTFRYPEVPECAAALVGRVARVDPPRGGSQCSTGSSRRHGPTPSRNSRRAASPSRSPDGTPNTTGISSSAPRPNGKSGPPPSGWAHTPAIPTTCERHWTGPFRQAGMRRSAWRSPPLPCRCGSSSR